VAIAALARFSQPHPQRYAGYECLAVLRSDLAVARCKPLPVVFFAPDDTPSLEALASMGG